MFTDMEKFTPLISEGIQVVKLNSDSLINEIRGIIKSSLSRSTDEYCRMERGEFHKEVEKAQDLINTSGILRKFVRDHEYIFQRISDYDDISWVSVMKLRAIRPVGLCGFNDAVPFHRETLYANYQMSYQHNVWIPIDGVNGQSAIKFFPGSHTLLDASLIIEEDVHHPIKVERFSAGHRIGYPYLPKMIHKTKELRRKPQKVEVKEGEAAVFSAMLVHGGGVNTGSSIRYSVDTGFLPSTQVIENKKLFASHGKPHYLSLDRL